MSDNRRSGTVDDGIADIRKRFLGRLHAPPTSPSMVVGTAELAWYRGEQSGMARVLFWLQDTHPRIAAEAQKEFAMNEDGDLVLGISDGS